MNYARTTILILLLAAVGAHASESPDTTLAHVHGVNVGASELFEASGTWSVTLAAYCYEGFGNVEATVFDDSHEVVAVVTVMGEGIEREVLETEAGRFYVVVQPSYWHVYNWELLVESGEGRDVSVGSALRVVSHADHHAAEGDASANAAAEPDSIWDGVFTLEQAQRGQATYQRHCAACHGFELISEDGYAPDMTGFIFTSRWHGTTVLNRFERMRTTMPVGNPGGLTEQEYADIIAYVLSFNDYPAGDGELLPGPHLERILIEPRP